MANIRVRIKNVRDLEAMLPKLKRSLTAQYNVELEEEGQGKGIFILVVKDVLQLKQFALIKKLLDSYGFEFYLRTVDEDGNKTEDLPEQQEVPEFPPEEHCDCEMCREIRGEETRVQKLVKELYKVPEPGIGIKMPKIAMPKVVPPKAKANPKKAEQDIMEAVAKELMEAVKRTNMDLKIDLAKRI